MAVARKSAIRIGTSGWHYKHWVGPFYPAGTSASKMLPFYFERFDTVELNNSFYHLPKQSSLENWRDSTPDGFCFAVKGSRFITHMKKLKDPGQALERFFGSIEHLQHKLGPILFQLPPNWELDTERFLNFLDALPRHHRYAFEFRNASWSVPAVYKHLERHRAAYCIFDLAGTQSPIEITTDFAYVRLHGPGGKYKGSYSDDALYQWADRIRDWQRSLRGVYVYFDNDDSGYAAQNALKLRSALDATKLPAAGAYR